MIQNIILQQLYYMHNKTGSYIKMATKNKHPERFGWWPNELESLGVSPKRCNELNDKQEVSNLTENLKQIFYQAYKTSYDEK
jgi:hypothetical protein